MSHPPSQDGAVEIAVAAHRAGSVMHGSVFRSVEEASASFRCAPLGYAATPQDGVYDGVALAAGAGHHLESQPRSLAARIGEPVPA